jgi:hypothetical protein
MAQAIKFDHMIRDGVVKDQAELARLGFVTRARITQIMNLLNLAPAIQLGLLELGPVNVGKDMLTERQLRQVSEHVDGENRSANGALLFIRQLRLRWRECETSSFSMLVGP